MDLRDSAAIHIRDCRQSEHADILAVFNSARACAGCFGANLTTADEFAALINGEELFVAEHAGAIAGFVAVWAPENFIHHLYVLPAAQGRGVGSSLLQFCEARYGRTLSLKCSLVNVRALQFYQRKGWVAKGAGIGDDGPWDHLFLE